MFALTFCLLLKFEIVYMKKILTLPRCEYFTIFGYLLKKSRQILPIFISNNLEITSIWGAVNRGFGKSGEQQSGKKLRMEICEPGW